MDISIVIPNYNGEQLLRKNLPNTIMALSLYLSKHNARGEIIIVDDNSFDKSVAVVKSVKISDDKVNIKLLLNYKNLGFSSTVNKGVADAKGQIVVLLNSDVVPDENFLDPLIRNFDSDQVFAVACMEKSLENGETILRGRGTGVWKKGFLMHQKGNVDKSKLTLWASGGSSAFKKDIWDKLGGLYSIYDPFYWEDIDLSYRAMKSGYKIIFEKDSIVSHEHGQGAIRNRFPQNKIRIIAYRNQCLFTWINATDTDVIVGHILWLPIHLLKAIFRSDFAFLVGFMQACFQVINVISLRRRTQLLVTMTDRTVTDKIQ
jgi:GT2 family glycosyltransferase